MAAVGLAVISTAITTHGGTTTHLVQNLSIDRDDFDTIPLVQRVGGWGAANRVFGGQLALLRHQFRSRDR